MSLLILTIDLNGNKVYHRFSTIQDTSLLAVVVSFFNTKNFAALEILSATEFSFKVNESRYIALFVFGESIKKLFSIAPRFVFSQYF